MLWNTLKVNLRYIKSNNNSHDVYVGTKRNDLIIGKWPLLNEEEINSYSQRGWFMVVKLTGTRKHHRNYCKHHWRRHLKKSYFYVQFFVETNIHESDKKRLHFTKYLQWINVHFKIKLHLDVRNKKNNTKSFLEY